MSAVYQDTGGQHWFGGNGIARWDSDSGTFTGFWNWENNPGMGVGQWVDFAEDADGTLFSSEQYGNLFRFNTQTNLWDYEMHVSANKGLPGMESDAQGNVWVAGRWDIYKWDGAAWSTVELPDPDYFVDLGGMKDIDFDAEGVMWISTNDGLVLWDGETFARYGTDNSPLPFLQVWSLDIREDGLIGISNVQYVGAAGGIVTIAGDIDDPESWTSYPYGDSPLLRWEVGAASFDANGDLWVAQQGEGVAVLTIPPIIATGDLNADGVVNVDDLFLLLAAWGPCPPPPDDCPADLDDDGVVGVDDLFLLLNNWG
jgi:hypothetical protein